MVNRNQGSFVLRTVPPDCRGSGSIIEHPCDECHGTGVTTRTRTINVRIPPGSRTVSGSGWPVRGEAGLRGSPSGDLYVTVHVRPDKVFGRDGDDLTVTVPVSFTELALGTTLSVPDSGRQGRRSSAQGHGRRPDSAGPRPRVPKRSGGHGDLLVTVKVSVPSEPRGRGAGGPEALRRRRAGQWIRSACRLGRESSVMRHEQVRFIAF